MKQSLVPRLFYTLLIALLLTLTPSIVVAEEADLQPSFATGVVIAELQTGLGSGQTDKEYIELYNATETVVDLAEWQLWYMPETRATLEAYRIITLDNVMLEPYTSLLLAAEAYVPNQVAPAQTFEKMLSAEGGSLVLLAPEVNNVCQLTVRDAFAWGAGKWGAGDAAIFLPKSKDKVFARTIADNTYYDTRNNLIDFVGNTFSGTTSTTPYMGTPGATNPYHGPIAGQAPILPGIDFARAVTDPNCDPVEVPPTGQPPQTTDPTTEPPVTIVPPPHDDSGETDPVFPARNKGLAAPHITELLPNPASPQTDAADEFVEFYNSNNTAFELTGFTLVAGKRSYTFPDGTLIEPKSFVAFYSAETRLALSNSGGQVQLLDPFGNVIGQTHAYGAAKDGQAWALANGKWHWTVSPTPKAANVVQAPAAVSKKKNSASKTSATAQTIKGASATADKQGTSTTEQLASVTPSTPIHPAMLALVGIFAILYGIYEYRGDLANKIYQLRTNRAARRSLRQKAEGR